MSGATQNIRQLATTRANLLELTMQNLWCSTEGIIIDSTAKSNVNRDQHDVIGVFSTESLGPGSI